MYLKTREFLSERSILSAANYNAIRSIRSALTFRECRFHRVSTDENIFLIVRYINAIKSALSVIKMNKITRIIFSITFSISF